jgi:uncharacterized membrane-anchored protein YhcB (DUF1043 family)
MQSKFKKISLIVSIITFLFFCALFLFLYKEIENNTKISEQTQLNLQKEISRREEIKNFNDSFKTIEKDKLELETHFAKSSDIVPFLNTIEKTASNVGTKAEVSFIEVAKDNTGLVVEMKNTGSFEQVYKFLMLLENSPYELEFSSVEMNSVSTEEVGKNGKSVKRNEWEATFKIKLISFI